MTLETLLAIYCLIVVLASTAGGHLPSLIRMTHLRTQLLISFVGGLMLGIALLHLLPHAVVILESPSVAGIACLAGIIGMFLLLRAFHPPHAHGFVDATPRGSKAVRTTVKTEPWGSPPATDQSSSEMGPLGEPGLDDQTGPGSDEAENPLQQREGIEHQHKREHGQASGHDDHDSGCRHAHPHTHSSNHHTHHGGAGASRSVGWVGILIGLWLHTMIDGVALAASTVADAQHTGITLAGLGTFLAIALHKPLDAFAITSTMHSGGWSPLHQGVINVVFALACPAGALLFYFGVTHWTASSIALGWGLAISAGFFICISLSDLLPEVSFHQHDRGKLTLSLLLGIGLAIAVENLPGHAHSHAGTIEPESIGPESTEPTASLGESEIPWIDEAPSSDVGPILNNTASS